MARRPQLDNPESLRVELLTLLQEFEKNLLNDELRPKVITLVKAFHKLRDLGSSLISVESNSSNAARSRILQYFQKYTGIVLQSDEFLVVSGIQEYARRIRELRVQYGWPIISGETAKQMMDDGELELDIAKEELKPDTYILLRNEQDRDAAHRWTVANEIRKENWSVKTKLLEYFKKNIARPVTGEELSYLAAGASEWPRRIRELRTEEGWPIRTKSSGRPDLPVGTYILEEDRQAERHDRRIPDPVQVQVLERDHYRCVKCGWSHESATPGDPRHLLELHHIMHHAHGGKNEADNLVTLCNVDHDDVHRLDKDNLWSKVQFYDWLMKK